MVFTPVWIFTTSAFVVTFIALVLIAMFLTEPFDNINFSFKRVFPFEVPEHLNSFSSIYKVIMYLFSAMCFAPLFTLLNNSNGFQDLLPITIINVCVFGLAGICFIFIHFFNVTHVNAHLRLFIGFLCLSLLGNALTAINGFIRYKTCLEHGENPLILPICGGFAALFTILLLVVALNPKLLTWARLDKVEGEENKYVRPKKFPLAYSEWLVFLFLFVGELSLLLELTVA